MRADLHTHTVFSDGELIPAELVRRAMVLGHDMIAITDHVDMTNVEFVASNVAKAVELCEDYIRVIPGVEITHVPPSKIDHVAKLARRNGAEWIVVHGETVTEPVAPGTNRASAENPEIDVLAHPGFITVEEAQIAKDNDVLLEVSGRAGHNIRPREPHGRRRGQDRGLRRRHDQGGGGEGAVRHTLRGHQAHSLNTVLQPALRGRQSFSFP